MFSLTEDCEASSPIHNNGDSPYKNHSTRHHRARCDMELLITVERSGAYINQQVQEINLALFYLAF